MSIANREKSESGASDSAFFGRAGRFEQRGLGSARAQISPIARSAPPSIAPPFCTLRVRRHSPILLTRRSADKGRAGALLLPLILSVDMTQVSAYTSTLVTQDLRGFLETIVLQELISFFVNSGGLEFATFAVKRLIRKQAINPYLSVPFIHNLFYENLLQVSWALREHSGEERENAQRRTCREEHAGSQNACSE